MIDKETAVALAKEAGLDWQRGYMLDDEADNRYHTLCNLAVAHIYKEADIQATVEEINPRFSLFPDDTALLREALEALHNITKHFGFTRLHKSTLADTTVRGEAHKAITALRERLGEKV